MLPTLSLNLFGTRHSLSTVYVLLGLAQISAAIAYALVADRRIGRARLVALILAPSLAAFIGGRLFHALFERPGFYLAHPQALWQRSDGQTFYGAFFAGALAFHLLTRWMVARPQRGSVWDAAAISLASAVFFLRLACFACGCCWGTITDVPWAVTYYNPAGVMPLLGVPVHPVQVYDALLSLIMTFGLVALWRRRPSLRGRLIYCWCVGYAACRLVTEFFRADGDRGLGFWPGHLSNSQVISLVLIAWCVAAWRSQMKAAPA